MTELDHSSVVSLLYDLNWYRNGLFRFRYDNMTSTPWRLKEAFAGDDGVQFCVEYATGITDDFFAILNGGQLVKNIAGSSFVRMTVMLASGFSDPFVDNSQRDQLDKNLRGIFS